MLAHTGKRSATELSAGDEMEMSGSVYHDLQSSDYAIQFRNVRSNSMKDTERNSSEKLIFSRRTFRSSRGSSAVFPSSPSKQKEIHVSNGDTISLESSSRQMDTTNSASRQMGTIASESFPRIKATQVKPVELEKYELPYMTGCCRDASRASGSSSAPVHSHKCMHQPQHKDSDSHPSLIFRASLTDNAQSFSLRNLGCMSISDIQSSNFSSIDHSYNIDPVRSRFHTGGSSSHRGIDIIQSSVRGLSISPRNSNIRDQFVADQLPAQENTRRARHQPVNSFTNAVSVRTRRFSRPEMNPKGPSELILDPQVLTTESCRANSRENRLRSEPRDDRPQSLSELGLDSEILTTQRSFGESVNTSVQASLEEPTPPESSTANSTSRYVNSDDRFNRSAYPHGSSHNDDAHQPFSMRDITEVMLALERIEQARQQLLLLESNFFDGLALHDQHRNMRMDIDNMTYEELLDLEEKIGTVSTALTEEMISKCLKKRIYDHILHETQECSSDDIKCSICQEEYCAGDEVGTLACGHLYHANCIQRWLRMKNWCPVCKVYAASF